MKILKPILFFLIVLIIGGGVVISGLSISFLESSISSFSFIKVSSDNRARDTIVSLAKASEGRMNSKGYIELNQTFSRLKDITKNDSDGFHVLEIVLTDLDGNILASSELSPEKEKYKSEVFTQAYRMRKWQYPDPIQLDIPIFKMELPSHLSSKYYNYLEPILEKYFPEAKATTALVSSAIYHQIKLDVVGAIHLVYARGNYQLFLDKQKEMYFWMVSTYTLIVIALSIVITLFYILFSYFNKNNKKLEHHKTEYGEPNPPIVQRVIEGDNLTRDSLYNVESLSVGVPKFGLSNWNKNENVSKDINLNIPNINQPSFDKNKNVVVDAIYLGDYGD